MKKVTALLVALSLVLLVGCASEVTPAKVEAPSPEAAAAEAQPVTIETYKVGDTVSIGDVKITLNGARFSKGSEYFKPEAGEKWLTINATIENQSSEAFASSSIMMFSLYDEDDYSADLAFTNDEKGSLDGEIGAGRKIRGEMSYSVSEGQTQWELIFEPNVFGTGQAIFVINAEDVAVE